MGPSDAGDQRTSAAGDPPLDALIARDPAHPALPDALRRSAERHAHLCPRQVLGARLALAGAAALGIALPQSDKRLIAIVESDGCFSDGVAVMANCWVGRRTMRVEDYGRIAVTFVDTGDGRAVRVRPQRDVRGRVGAWGAAGTDGGADSGSPRWVGYVLGYQRMPDGELVDVLPVELAADPRAIVSHPDRRAVCVRCGEEVSNGRELDAPAGPLCVACADPARAYYRPRSGGRSSASA